MAWIDYKTAYDMVPQNWIIHCLKMYKISDEVMKFIDQTLENWRVELIAGGKSLTEAKIQRGIFQGDVLSPLLFVIAVRPLSQILRKFASGYKITKSQEKINPLMYMVDFFAKNENEVETHKQAVKMYSQDTGIKFGI